MIILVMRFAGLIASFVIRKLIQGSDLHGTAA